MSVDDRIRESLRRVAATSSTDLDATRETLRRRAHGPRRAGIIALAAAAAVVGVVALPGPLLRAVHHSSHAGAEYVRVVTRLSTPALSVQTPLSVATGPRGDFYVSESSDRISHYSAAGRLIARWGSRGAGDGQLRLVTGTMAVGPDDRLYIADTGNSRIDVFTPQGRFVTSYGRFGGRLGAYHWPTDVVVDGAGRIYVADQSQSTITMLSRDGRAQWRIGRSNSPALSAPPHLGLSGANGQVLAVNELTGAVMNLSPQGKVSVLTSGAGRPAGPRFCGVGQTDSAILTSTCGTPQTPARVYARQGTTDSWAPVDLRSLPEWDANGAGWALAGETSVAQVRAVAP